MAIYKYKELQDKINNIDNNEICYKICANIKKYRKQKYQEFKDKYDSDILNPYTTENFADLMDYNHTHYKRFESENDPTKRMPLCKILRACIILDVSLSDILK